MDAAQIPVDLYNPGQVFACLGFLEAAEILLGDAEGGFDWRDEANVTFRLRAKGERNPFAAVLEFLALAEVASIAPAVSEQRTEKWNIPTNLLDENDPFPFPAPPSPATLPASLKAKGKQIIVDHWGEGRQTNRDAVKFWAGAGGYPGVALLRDALDLARPRIQEAYYDPFSLGAPQSSSFRFDWRRDYIPIDLGFSPNDHGDVTMVGFPLVEILAAIGLANSRPKQVNKLLYRYGVLGVSDDERPFDPLFLRAALGGAIFPFPQRFFQMRLGWPGQENQARCITDVIEEPRR